MKVLSESETPSGWCSPQRAGTHDNRGSTGALSARRSISQTFIKKDLITFEVKWLQACVIKKSIQCCPDCPLTKKINKCKNAKRRRSCLEPPTRQGPNQPAISSGFSDHYAIGRRLTWLMSYTIPNAAATREHQTNRRHCQTHVTVIGKLNVAFD